MTLAYHVQDGCVVFESLVTVAPDGCNIPMSVGCLGQLKALQASIGFFRVHGVSAGAESQPRSSGGFHLTVTELSPELVPPFVKANYSERGK